MVNINLLRSETIKRGHTDKEVAENALHISVQAYGKKLRGKTKITTDDADSICRYLKIEDQRLKADIFLV